MNKETKQKIVLILLVVFIVFIIGSLTVFRLSNQNNPIWTRRTMDFILANSFLLLALLMHLKSKYAGEDQQKYKRSTIYMTLIVWLFLLTIYFLSYR